MDSINPGKGWAKGKEYVPRQVCAACGKSFYAPPAQIKRCKGGVLTCSYRCAGIMRSGEANPGWKEKTKRTCVQCNREFEVPPSHEKSAKYCSKECQLKRAKKEEPVSEKNAGEKKEKHVPAKANPNWHPHNWKGGDIEKECESCGKKFVAKRSAVNHGQGRFCTHACYAREYTKVMQSKTHTTARGGKREDLSNQYFRSSWEANWARYLNWLISIEEIKAWEYEADTFEFFGIKRGTRFYTPDFKITNNDGSQEYHEIKGYMDDTSRVKLERMAKYYPDVKVTVIDADQYRVISRQIRSLIPGWEVAAKHAW